MEQIRTLQKRSERNRLSLLYRELDTMLIASASILVRRGSIAFVDIWPTVSHASLLYLPTVTHGIFDVNSGFHVK